MTTTDSKIARIIEGEISIERTMKYCKGCDKILDRELNFYKASGTSVQSRCKACHYVLKGYVKRPKQPPASRKPRLNPFHKKPQAFQDQVLLHYPTMPGTALARKFGININTFISWRAKGYITKRA
jgi:hypothetical protein